MKTWFSRLVEIAPRLIHLLSLGMLLLGYVDVAIYLVLTAILMTME